MAVEQEQPHQRNNMGLIGNNKKKKADKEKQKEAAIAKMVENEKAKTVVAPPKPEVKIFGQKPMVIVGIGSAVLVLGIFVVLALSKRKTHAQSINQQN